MNSKFRILAGITIIVMGLAFFASQVDAGISIGRISSFEGKAYILSGSNIGKVEFVGQVVNQSDKIQTIDGTVDVTLNDGAFIKISPYSTTAVSEREEETGWLFKRKSLVRRITCFVGKLRFKSGDKVKTNFFQTPTAVCGLRGSDGELGYDPAKLESYLQIYDGEAGAFKGNFLKGFFENPGIDAAEKSKVWSQLSNAVKYKDDPEKTDGEKDLAASLVLLTAAQELESNPDDDVIDYGKEELDAAELSVTAAKQKIEKEVASVKFGKPLDELNPTELEEVGKLSDRKMSKVVKDTKNITDADTVTEMVKIKKTIKDTEAKLTIKAAAAAEEAWLKVTTTTMTTTTTTTTEASPPQ